MMEIEDKDKPLRLLEAILFACVEPVDEKALAARLPEGTNVLALLRTLGAHYENRGVRLVETNGAWAFRTAPDLAESMQWARTVQRKPSRAALETLAIIAYHQPVTRAEIESIRGVATNKGTLDVLMEAGWIKPGRRKDVPGRPLTWITTPEFMDHFGISALTDLPGIEDLKASGLLDKRPAIEHVSAGAGLFHDEESERNEISSEEDFDLSDVGFIPAQTG
ncbi:MAG: SMC-Scp complex subunit ScpB [Rhodospirillales bacterium]|nr:SMC-Scp complex subunit ScpB [Rhodospirillales bacterium]